MAYDPTTPVGTVRLLIADTDDTNLIFQDGEISQFLVLGNQNVYAAGAIAYLALIGSRSRLAKKIEREGYKSEAFAISEIRGLIADLKEMAITAGGLQTGDFGITDEHFESWRPEWRDYTTFIVE